MSIADNKRQPITYRGPIKDLYQNMSTLAPQTQMFMQGCPPELEAKYQRIQARSLVMRNLFALSAGVQKTVYWDLPEFSIGGDGRYDLMALMYGKIGMMGLQDGPLKNRHPAPDPFDPMTKALTAFQQ